MSWLKRDIIEAALEEIGFGPNSYDIRAEDYATGLNRLNTLMAQWQGDGVGLGYPASNSADGDDLDADSNLPPDAVNGVIAGLAVALAPGFGKQVSKDTKVAARKGEQLIRRKTATIPSRKADLTTYPAGAGHKRRFDPQLHRPDTEVTPDERNS
jgi:hypothetical protein